MDLATSRKALMTSEKITVALIATYPAMSRATAQLVEGTNIQLLDIYASFEQAAEEAKRIEAEVDVILTRGGTGRFVKNAASIPVISIPITPFDLTLSVSDLPAEYKRVAFCNYQRAIFGTEQIGELFGKKIFQYLFTNQAELRQAANEAKADGCQVFIGGAEGISYARELGMEGIEIVSGREAIYQALTEAIAIIQVKREERKQSTRLKIAFDSLAEGICITDERGTISVFNPAAAGIFKLNHQQLVGENIHDISIGDRALTALHQQKPELNQLERAWNITLSTNHIPIYMDQNFIGLVSTFQDVTKIQQLEGQIRRQLNQKGFQAKYTFDSIIGSTHAMETAKKLAALYAQTDSSVLIEGESGTGKELFAHSIHSASPRSVGPFVTVNCAAIPEQLLESELFGYAPGAFTGARREGKQGLFELAHNGTIFLDEIGEMPKYLQSRLLRVLQEKEVMRVGDDKIISVNCRVISATNKDLGTLVSKGEFREDLYYRLNIFNVKVPPLRDRREDIPLLCEHFLEGMGISSHAVGIKKSVDEQLKRLRGYRWPGNVRELSSVCARIALLQTAGQGEEARQYLRMVIDSYVSAARDTVSLDIEASLPLKGAMEEAEQQYISAILERCGNNRTLASKQLGIGRTTLWRRYAEGEEERGI